MTPNNPLLSDENREAVYARIIKRIVAANTERKNTNNLLEGEWTEKIFVPKGWAKIIDELDTELNKLCPNYRVEQAKEKFAGLRYYVENIPKEIQEEANKLITEAEKISFQTCQECGQLGQIGKTGNLLITLCDTHGAAEHGWQPLGNYNHTNT